MLKTAPMTRAQKLAKARNSKAPGWSSLDLANAVAGELGKNAKQWHTRIKNAEIEGRLRSSYTDEEVIVLSRALGVDTAWSLLEDGNEEVRWVVYSTGNATLHKSVQQINEKRVPYLGYVPAFNVEPPDKGNLELESSAGVEVDAFYVKVRGKSLWPNYRPGTMLFARRAPVPILDTLNVVYDEASKERHVGQVVRRDNRLFLNFANAEYPPMDVTNMSFEGYVYKAVEENEDGLSL